MECSCPLVSSGLIELHRTQCYCSQGMMETIFSKVAGRPIEVELRQTIGRGDKVCLFIVKQSSEDADHFIQQHQLPLMSSRNDDHHPLKPE